MRILADFIQVAYATGGHSVTRQETNRQEVCKRPSLHHNYISSCIQSRQFFASTLREQLLESKN
jgi:hypothetical protein